MNGVLIKTFYQNHSCLRNRTKS